LEGLHPDPEDIERDEAWIRGDITSEEALELVKKSSSSDYLPGD
jgi:hypothetical protein